jgi:hypothetical protein
LFARFLYLLIPHLLTAKQAAMSSIVFTTMSLYTHIANSSDDIEEMDLSSFEQIEELDDAAWKQLKRFTTMKRLKLPPLLIRIRDSAQIYRPQLIDVPFPASLRSIENYAFDGCSGLAMRDMKLPDGLEELGMCAFRGCRGLTGKLSTRITGNFAFYNCTGLSELDLENCKVIGEYCFQDCTGLILLNLPLTLQSIGYNAFGGCIGLAGHLIIPPFVSFIHPEAFKGCTGMINVKQAIEVHSTSFESWKARGNVLMTLIRFDDEYRRAVEEKGYTRNSAVSDFFLSGISKEAQLIYKAAAHVDGTDNLANGIFRLINSFLPMDRKYYGTILTNEEVDRRDL